jgi:hypothetical protein
MTTYLLDPLAEQAIAQALFRVAQHKEGIRLSGIESVCPAPMSYFTTNEHPCYSLLPGGGPP